MIKFITLLALFFISLEARENPFFPLKGEKDLPNTSNKDLSVAPLKRAAVSLPSSARRIQKVTFEYINLDGSVQEKSIDLNNAVDWHIPIFVTQSMGSLKNNNKVSNTTKAKATKNIHLFTSKNIKFYKNNKELKVITKDKMIRDFLLTNPHRIVLDFKKDVSLKSEIKSLKSSVFKKVNLGTHDGYYRAVIELDGFYRYKKEKKSKGYSIYLR